MEPESTARDVGQESSTLKPTQPVSPRFLGILFLMFASAVAGLFFLRASAPRSDAYPPEGQIPQPLFQGWAKPDLAILVSGEMHGYLQPCGCSSPQKGGLARRYNFLQTLKAKGWPQIVAVDLGDLAAPPGPMTLLKYTTSMKALQLMNYSAIGLGERELAMPLHDALAEFSLNNEKPRPVALNLANAAKKNDMFYELNVRPYEIVAGKSKIGVIGLTDPDVAKAVRAKLPANEPDIQFTDETKVIGPALAKMSKEGVDFGVLLYQGTEKSALAFADLSHKITTAGKLPPVRLIVCLADNEAPPGVSAQSPQAPETHVVSIGHKGIYVGVVGFFKNKAKGYDVKYQLVTVGPEYETKPGQEKANPVQQLMEQYALEVKAKNYLAKSPRGTHFTQAKFKDAYYVGSERCGDCHEHAEKVWAKTGHSHAYDTLVLKAKNPGLRQFDPECIACHTVGFKDHTGYFDPPMDADAKKIAKHNSKLLGVGCESCHGPASDHVNNPNNKDLYSVINPYRPTDKEADPTTTADEKNRLMKARMLKLDFFCQKCHDIENDVHWGDVNFIKGKWGKIEHYTPKKGNDGGVQIIPANGKRPSAGIDALDEKAFPRDAGKKD